MLFLSAIYYLLEIKPIKFDQNENVTNFNCNNENVNNLVTVNELIITKVILIFSIIGWNCLSNRCGILGRDFDYMFLIALCCLLFWSFLIPLSDELCPNPFHGNAQSFFSGVESTTNSTLDECWAKQKNQLSSMTSSFKYNKIRR